MAAEKVGALRGDTHDTTVEYPVANGVTVYPGDFVYVTGGRVSNASIAGKRLLGVVEGVDTQSLAVTPAANATKSAVGNSAGTVKVLVNINKSQRYLLKSDQDTTPLAESQVGSYFDLIGNAGAQLVDSSSTSTTGQLTLVKFNPGIRGTDNTFGIFVINEDQLEDAS